MLYLPVTTSLHRGLALWADAVTHHTPHHRHYAFTYHYRTDWMAGSGTTPDPTAHYVLLPRFTCLHRYRATCRCHTTCHIHTLACPLHTHPSPPTTATAHHLCLHCSAVPRAFLLHTPRFTVPHTTHTLGTTHTLPHYHTHTHTHPPPHTHTPTYTHTAWTRPDQFTHTHRLQPHHRTTHSSTTAYARTTSPSLHSSHRTPAHMQDHPARTTCSQSRTLHTATPFSIPHSPQLPWTYTRAALAPPPCPSRSFDTTHIHTTTHTHTHTYHTDLHPPPPHRTNTAHVV